MRYETSLIIGKDTKRVVGSFTYFTVIATLNLGKCTRSNLLLLPWENHTPNIQQWEFYAPIGENDIPIVHEDRSNAKMQPIPINDVIKALEKDLLRDQYRPTEWALSILNKINDTAISNEEFSVMLYGH